MPRIFISHSSANNDKAVELRDWVEKNSWDDVLLDLDPERGIVASPPLGEWQSLTVIGIDGECVAQYNARLSER